MRGLATGETEVAERIREYDDLKLEFERRNGGSYTVIAESSDGRRVRGSFTPPLNDEELDDLVRDVGLVRRARRSEQGRLKEIEEFGSELFAGLVREQVADVYQAARAAAENRERGLRITLNMSGAPELMRLPWEFLYRRPRFLSQSMSTPVVRSLDLEIRAGLLTGEVERRGNEVAGLAVREVESRVELLLDPAEGVAFQWPRAGEELDVELRELGLEVLGLEPREQLRVDHARDAVPVDDVELHLDAHELAFALERAPLQHATEHLEVALDLLAVALPVLPREADLVDVAPHGPSHRRRHGC
jgi:hypothetical protein